MDSSLDWLKRNSPHYDPNRIGAISHAKVLEALTAAGKVVLMPLINVCPYDLVIDEGGLFLRVQCKTGRLVRGAVYFQTYRLFAATQETGGKRRVRDYKGEVDFFGVYCLENDRVYLIPMSDVTVSRVCSLRVLPPKNNQRKGIRWADDYLVVPLDIPPEAYEW